MIPQRFDYLVPGSSAEATVMLAQSPSDTALLGGGTWLVPELQQGLRRGTARIVDLRRAGLSGVTSGDGRLHVGATTTYADLLGSARVATQLPLLAAMARTVTGGAALHNQATIGGSLCAARPTSDALGAVAAAGGQAVVEGPGGVRRLPAVELVAGVRQTTIGPDELLVGIEFASHADWGVGYDKLKRGTSGWPLVGASALVRRNASGGLDARLSVAGLSPRPLVVDALDLPADGWQTVVEDAVRTGLTAVGEPYGDELASGAYRLAVAPAIARRAVVRALTDLTARDGAHHDAGADDDR